jgi:integrase
MRVRLKGLNRITKKLANGTKVTYYYAWKSGPRLEGDPGSPEFIASYNRAVASRAPTTSGTLASLIDAYRKAPEFTGLAERTRADYEKQIIKIRRSFDTFPVVALSDRRARGEFLEWRDQLALTSHRQADYALTVVARILGWAAHRGKIPKNPLESPGKLYRGSRRDAVWSDEDEKRYLASVPDYPKLPLLLGIWTGQREGDLLAARWEQYDGKYIRLRQSKTGRRLTIPAAAALKEALDLEKARLAASGRYSPSATILLTSRDTSWTEGGFRASWNKKRKAAGIEG